MKFSFVVPVYGTERYLDECVASLLAQTDPDFEVILVDDCSPDPCPALCDRWQARDERIRVIHKPVNEGLGFARNTGMDAAQGEYVLFVDSDDYLAPDTLEKCREALTEGMDILVFGAELRYEDAAGNARWCDRILPEAYCADTAQKKAHMFSRLSANKVFPYAWNKVYSREFLQRVPTRFEQTKLIEDFLFNISVFGYAERIGALPQALYTYRKPAHETLASRYNPEFFALSKRKYLLEEQFLADCGAMEGECRHQIHCGYVKHLISAIIRNQSKAAQMPRSQQKRAALAMVEDPLTLSVMEQMQPQGAHYRLICAMIRRKNAGVLLLLGSAVRFLQQHLLPLYRRFL